jgi:hypothetical protein
MPRRPCKHFLPRFMMTASSGLGWLHLSSLIVCFTHSVFKRTQSHDIGYCQRPDSIVRPSRHPFFPLAYPLTLRSDLTPSMRRQKTSQRPGDAAANTLLTHSRSRLALFATSPGKLNSNQCTGFDYLKRKPMRFFLYSRG